MKRNGWILLLLMFLGTLTRSVSAQTPFPWPPDPHKPYPDISFIKADMSTFKMSDLKGRFVVVHYRGMTCVACQNMAARRDLMWKDPRVTNVDVLLFNRDMKPPTAEDARWWSRAIQVSNQFKNEIVVSAPAWTNAPEIYQTTYNMVIGGQLLDETGVVQASVVRPRGASLPTDYWRRLRAELDQWLKKARANQ